MSGEIIYEKKYPCIDPVKKMEQIDQKLSKEPKKVIPPYQKMLRKIQVDTTYVLMPERIKASEEFIRTAIEVSKLYELDTRIERHLDHISVYYSFDCGGCLRDINRVFGMADQASFFRDVHGRDITVSLDFFTHATFRNGKIMFP